MEEQNQDSSGQKSPMASKELLYSEKFNESPFLLKKKVASPPHIFKVPESSALKTVQMFLPKMKAANNDLEEKLKMMPASAVDIENTDDTEGPLIEMDLAVVPHDDSSEEDESDSDSSTSDSDSETHDIKSDIKLTNELRQKRKSNIQVLNSDSAGDSGNT